MNETCSYGFMAFISASYSMVPACYIIHGSHGGQAKVRHTAPACTWMMNIRRALLNV